MFEFTSGLLPLLLILSLSFPGTFESSLSISMIVRVWDLTDLIRSRGGSWSCSIGAGSRIPGCCVCPSCPAGLRCDPVTPGGIARWPALSCTLILCFNHMPPHWQFNSTLICSISSPWSFSIFRIYCHSLSIDLSYCPHFYHSDFVVIFSINSTPLFTGIRIHTLRFNINVYTYWANYVPWKVRLYFANVQYEFHYIFSTTKLRFISFPLFQL